MAKVVYKDYTKIVEKKIANAMKQGVGEIAQTIVDEIKESIHPQPGGGRTYRIYRYGLAGKVHTASAAGEPPVQLTSPSALHEAIGWEVSAEAGIRTVKVKIGVVLPYRSDHPEEVPEWLEFGTSKMSPRPFIGPAMNNTLTKGSAYRKVMRSKVLEAVY